MTRYAAKRDQNDGEIATYLRACGYQLRQAPTTAGFDYYVRRGSNPVTVFLEIKTRLGRLTENEIDFKDYVGKGPYVVARTEEEARLGVERWI